MVTPGEHRGIILIQSRHQPVSTCCQGEGGGDMSHRVIKGCSDFVQCQKISIQFFVFVQTGPDLSLTNNRRCLSSQTFQLWLTTLFQFLEQREEREEHGNINAQHMMVTSSYT